MFKVVSRVTLFKYQGTRYMGMSDDVEKNGAVRPQAELVRVFPYRFL